MDAVQAQMVPFLTNLPDDVLGQVIRKCDVPTLFKVKQTCRELNVKCDLLMNEQVAVARVSHTPTLYLQLGSEWLKTSRMVALAACTRQPDLIVHPMTPESVRQDEIVQKVAAISSFLHKNQQLLLPQGPGCRNLFELLMKQLQSGDVSLARLDDALIKELSLCFWPKFPQLPMGGSELFNIKGIVDIFFRTMGSSRQEEMLYCLTPKRRDDEEYMLSFFCKVEPNLYSRLFHLASPRLREDENFMLKVIQSLKKQSCAQVLKFVSPRLQKSPRIVLAALELRKGFAMAELFRRKLASVASDRVDFLVSKMSELCL